jgi:hypothetical protein
MKLSIYLPPRLQHVHTHTHTRVAVSNSIRPPDSCSTPAVFRPDWVGSTAQDRVIAWGLSTREHLTKVLRPRPHPVPYYCLPHQCLPCSSTPALSFPHNVLALLFASLDGECHGGSARSLPNSVAQCVNSDQRRSIVRLEVVLASPAPRISRSTVSLLAKKPASSHQW